MFQSRQYTGAICGDIMRIRKINGRKPHIAYWSSFYHSNLRT